MHMRDTLFTYDKIIYCVSQKNQLPETHNFQDDYPTAYAHIKATESESH